MKRLGIWLQWLFGPVPPLVIPTPMKISEDHFCNEAERQVIPGGSDMPVRRFLVIHFTSGWSAQSSVDFWKTPAANGANAHIIIDRNGKIIQCRPFNKTAGHAGRSKWTHDGKTYEGLNSCSIGIELANCGDMPRENYPAAGMGELAGKPIPRKTAKHKNGGPIKQWETFTRIQYETCEALAITLCSRYNLDDVVGHDDIAPDRKVDPGPAFDMARLRKACGFPETV
jgi:N-acetylmuramoyl-L-alanine amidase